MSAEPNAYIMARPQSLAIRIVARMRRKMYDRFLAMSNIAPDETLLDVGATGARDYDSFNYVEAWYPHKHNITAVGLDDASYLETAYPGVTFRQADGRNLPFADRSFDVVHSSAVLEHVGNTDNQKQFVSELLRVARRGIFLTTPNRWHPVEFHTILPLVHWLPKRVFRACLRGTRYDFYASEDHLNLLGRRDLQELIPRGYSFQLSSVRLIGLPSNLMVWIEKQNG